LLTHLQENPVMGPHLCFEITETAAIGNLTVVNDFIDAMREFGCSFALDDFGSGLSSFTYLKNLKVDYLKIDGAFVRDITSNPIDRAMVEAVHKIGHQMGLKTVAEYVESDQILAVLRQIGVDYVQGNGVHRPEPLESLCGPALNTY
jgi:EAL domain-containing protein (putative c-di-GMP-specific phosphodiesterase class I)